MGFGGMGVWQLLIVLVIVLVLFGGRRLKSLGSDLGGALKGFRNAMDRDEEADGDSADKPRLATAEPDAEFAERQTGKERNKS